MCPAALSKKTGNLRAKSASVLPVPETKTFPHMKQVAKKSNHPSGPRGRKSTNSPKHRKDLNEMSREEITLSVYEHLIQETTSKRYHSSGLGSESMRRFAVLLGFKGNEQEWRTQFNELQKQHKAPVSEGINQKKFQQIINDDDGPFFCSLKELQAVLIKLRKGFDLVCSLKQLSRIELIWMIYRHLERFERNTLSFDSLLTYARKLGFAGGANNFEVEYDHLSRKYGWGKEQGPSLAEFAIMVNDKKGLCHCPDHELREILEELVSSIESMPLLQFGRELLVLKLFIACKPQPNDHLNMNGMRIFASCKGFNGSDAEWMTEYLAMCHDNSLDEAVGVSLQKFTELVSKESSVVYCSNAQLREILTELVLVRRLLMEDVILHAAAGTVLPSVSMAEELDAASKQGIAIYEESELENSTVLRVRPDVSTQVQRIIRGKEFGNAIESPSTAANRELDERASEAEDLKRLHHEQRRYLAEEQKALAKAELRLKALLGECVEAEARLKALLGDKFIEKVETDTQKLSSEANKIRKSERKPSFRANKGLSDHTKKKYLLR